jgi:hypothetical protein
MKIRDICDESLLSCSLAKLSWVWVSTADDDDSLSVSLSGGFAVDARFACCCLSSFSSSI